MLKLICYEWKKILKSRSGILLMLLLIGASGYQIKENISQPLIYYNFVSDEDIDTQKEQEKYEGYQFSEMEKELKIFDEEKDRVHVNAKRQLDEDYMQSMYGEHWKELVTLYENGTLTQEQLVEWKVPNLNVDMKPQDEVSLESFQMQYLYLDSDANLDLTNLYPNAEKLAHRERYLYTTQKAKQSDAVCFFGACDAFDEEYFDVLNERVLAISDRYYPTIIPNLMVDTAYRVNFLVLLAVVMLLGNMYSREHNAHTDIYLMTSRNGLRKVRAAKLLVALTIGLVIPLLVPLLSLFVEMMKYGNIAWDMFYYSGYDTSGFASYVFTYKELFFMIFASLIIGYTALTMTTVTISRFLKNTYTSGIVVLLVAILPIYNIFTFGELDLNIWFPSYLLMRIMENLTMNNVLFLTINGWGIPRIWLYCGVWLLGSIACWLLLYRKDRRHLM